MPMCATYNGTGQVTVVTPPPADMSTCALLIPTVGDSINDPFHLSAQDGLDISYAILTVWAVAVGWRILIRLIK